MVSGASVCPMKMLAATFMDSAPLVPITFCITTAIAAHQHLHDAQVIQDAEKRRNEDDDGQHLESEDGAEHVAGRAQLVAEDEFTAFGGVIQQMVDSAAQPPEGDFHRCFQHQKGKAELESQAPPQYAWLD